jgi:DNA-binding NtrC family response regulator
LTPANRHSRVSVTQSVTVCNDELIMSAIATLKRVSGRLRELLSGRDNTPVDEPDARNLLVVDDEEAICLSMIDYFSQHGFKVDTAREMEEAETLIKATNYNVIIQDLRLGIARRPDGLEIIRLVHKRNPDTRIIVLTSYGSAEVEEEARRAGADAFLRKPKPLSQVAQVVQGLIESPRTRTVRA